LPYSAQRLEKAGLSEYAQHVLQQICSQEWVLVRCLQNPEDLCDAEMLLDDMLTPKQAQRLLRMICYPENPAAASDNQEQPQVITRILEVCFSLIHFHDFLLKYCSRIWTSGA
jgi:hypothetical protein